jgi:hypothetical protein
MVLLPPVQELEDNAGGVFGWNAAAAVPRDAT